MTDTAWEQSKRRVAEFFRGDSASLSDSNGKITCADVTYDTLYILRSSCEKGILPLLYGTKLSKLPTPERKIPVIALCKENRPGFWVMVHSEDLEKLGGLYA